MMDGKLNFSVGPVMMDKEIAQLGAEQIPYFRTNSFSDTILDNEQMLIELLYAKSDSRAIFLTGSGTAGMEMSVSNMLRKKDKALVVNGGGFGARFLQLCKIYGIYADEIKLTPGESLKNSHLQPFENQGYTALLINMHETSTGVLYDMNLVSQFCKRNQLFFIVDAISAFLAEEIYMKKWGVDVLITASQKALALPPGMSYIVLSRRAVERAMKNEVTSLYFDIKLYLTDGLRGQTPFTPAVSVLIQLNHRLKKVISAGVEDEIQRVKELAGHFRKHIKQLPLSMFAETPSNAVTSLETEETVDAYEIFKKLESDYGIWICPNGGELKNKVFRVGHIGNLNPADNLRLIGALEENLVGGKNCE